MSAQRANIPVEVRLYRAKDEPAVLDLLKESLGSGPTGDRQPEFFRWKHKQNPFGPSYMFVAEAEDRIVGFRAFMRWRFRAGDRLVAAVRAVDTATHPDFQGMGIFSKLTRAALDTVRVDVDLVFNTPNEKSGPGYLKMGWKLAGRIPIWIHVRRPWRFARGLLSVNRQMQGETPGARPQVRADRASDLLHETAPIASILSEVRHDHDRLSTDHSAEYFSWRYGSPPFLDYRAIGYSVNGHLRGFAVFRVRPRGRLWESTVAEVIAPASSDGISQKLLKEVGHAARTDHLTCRFAAARRPGLSQSWLQAPGGMTFMVNSLHESVAPDPTDLRSWALSLGDLEVF